MFQTDHFFTHQQVKVTQIDVLAGFGSDGVNDGFLSPEGAVRIRRFYKLLADFVADINGRSTLAGWYQSSFSVSKAHSFSVSLRRIDVTSYRWFFDAASSPERGIRSA